MHRVKGTGDVVQEDQFKGLSLFSLKNTRLEENVVAEYLSYLLCGEKLNGFHLTSVGQKLKSSGSKY